MSNDISTTAQGQADKHPGPQPRYSHGRPKGAVNKRTLVRQALMKTFGLEGEEGFWIAIAMQAKAGDMQAAEMIASRLYPKLKPQADTVALSRPLVGSLEDKARIIVELMGTGEIPPDTAKELLNALADVGRLNDISRKERAMEQLKNDVMPWET